MFDAVVVGAGLSGAVVAERLAAAGRQVLVVEARGHVAGNCHDQRDCNGILVHRYGPHIFHTDDLEVWHYLSRFTDWIPYEHRVLASIEGRLVPVPFSLETIDRLFPARLAADYQQALLDTFPYGQRVALARVRESGVPLLVKLADYVERHLFRGYSAKQWGVGLEELDPAVTGRVPLVVGRDERYFNDRWQALPADGYTAMVESILRQPSIRLLLNTRLEQVFSLDPESGAMTLFGQPFAGHLIYTGMIDALFDYRYGELPYRTLRFTLEEVAPDYQPVATINYPDQHDHTRSTQFGLLQPQVNRRTVDLLMREYPGPYRRGSEDEPYYPLFTASDQTLFRRYHDHAATIPRLTLTGRLAEYKYYDMDDAVARALLIADRLNQGSMSGPG